MRSVNNGDCLDPAKVAGGAQCAYRWVAGQYQVVAYEWQPDHWISIIVNSVCPSKCQQDSSVPEGMCVS